ncbi:serine hydrolase domain-containing protein [Streptomyces violarus]|uniref:serine hydrolase domain-containing protein n=1 Tax=Streptomyces violarus TaxID=67380 RepID=UPI0021BF8F8B|nr:serine hydrolase domain-containing protein [Streptomyces violarus]MCT9138571.1 beta-lactamase family protein [Streptomyces violarus]
MSWDRRSAPAVTTPPVPGPTGSVVAGDSATSGAREPAHQPHGRTTGGTGADAVRVEGWARTPFEALADVFARVVAEQGGGAAALAIYLDGHPVVDLSHGGPSDARYLLFSVSKGVSAIAAQHAHAGGQLDLDAPICDVWPAMRRTATRRITTRHVLSHQAGLPLVDQELTVEDHVAGKLETALERQEPYWEPGTKHGYHAITYGALLDGVFQRALGTSVAEYIHAHIRHPLGLDLALGVPPSDNHDVLPLRTRPPMRTPLQSARRGLLFDAVGLGLLEDPSVFNRPDVLAAPWPATNLVASARDLARLYAAAVGPVDGVRLLDAEMSAALARTHSIGLDEVLGEPSHFGSGVQRPTARLPLLGPASYGHDGHAGSLALADPRFSVGMAFTTNVSPPVGGASAAALTLVAAARHCLNAPGRNTT